MAFNIDRSAQCQALNAQKTVNNLMSFTKTGQITESASPTDGERETFIDAHSRVKKQIDRMGRTTISPQSKFLMWWDVATTIALLWTAFVTPFEVGFLPSSESTTLPLFICNRLVDGVFIIDMVLAFFVPYRSPPSKGGMWVFDNRRIAKQYLTSWFALDLLTGVPFDFIISR